VSAPRGPAFWQAASNAPLPRAPLAGPLEADICIVGAGFTGLWTAYELLGAKPMLRVVVLERDVAGFGASGRNGGWVSGELSGSREAWAQRGGGRDAAIALERAIIDTVDEIGRVVEREDISCDFVKGGSLHVAQSELELARIRAEVEDDRLWGMGEGDAQLLSAAELRERVDVVDGVGARFTPHCARVQPARLAWGLAAAVERRGATIFEGTEVTAIEPGLVRTRSGDVRARHVVRALEGYTAGLRGHRRDLLPLTSTMLITEPLGDDVWARLGWDGAETMLDGRRAYAYLQRTEDGRIAIGGRGVPYEFGSRTKREGAVPAAVVEDLRGRLRGLFGEDVDVGVAGSWAGVLGVSRTWLPSVGHDPATGLAWAGGYAGEGVAAANLAGRTLRDLIVGGGRSELTRLAWVGPPERPWEREPFRWLGVRGVHRLLESADRREAAKGRPAKRAKLADRIAGR
jgi:glycine/D-amino acid oxidase-like deaminating enzyme